MHGIQVLLANRSASITLNLQPTFFSQHFINHTAFLFSRKTRCDFSETPKMQFQTRFNLTLFTRNFVSSASYLHLEVYHEEPWLGALKAEMAGKWRHEKPPRLAEVEFIQQPPLMENGKRFAKWKSSILNSCKFLINVTINKFS